MDYTDERQKYGLTCPVLVEAKYSKPSLKVDEGNVYIEALPNPLTESEMKTKYFTRLPIEKPTTDGDVEQMEDEISLLRDVRVPLSINPKIEREFRRVLLESYRARRRYRTDLPVDACILDENARQASSYLAAGGADGDVGFSLLGVSGCGKSTAIGLLLEHYPQVIRHHLPTGDLLQIVWIRIVVPVNGNLSETYIAFAEAIDEAVGNSCMHYAREMRKKASVGEKAQYLALLVRIFGIGALILDEIQNMNFAANKQASFESFLTVTNTTKVGLITIGTEEAFAKLYSKSYTARRTGTVISASEYCTHRDYFAKIASIIMGINWFREPLTISKELTDAMFAVTAGSIDRIISVWTDVQLDYVRSKEKPAITPEYIKRVATESRPLMDYMIRSAIISDPLLSPEVQDAMEADLNRAVVSDSVISFGMAIQVLTRGVADASKAVVVFKRTKNNIDEAGIQIEDMELAKIINRLMVSKRNGNKDADQLVVKAIEKVTHATKPNVHSKSKMPENDTQSIRLDFVSSTDDPLGGRKHA